MYVNDTKSSLSALSLDYTEEKFKEENGVKHGKITAFRTVYMKQFSEVYIIAFLDENTVLGKPRYSKISTF